MALEWAAAEATRRQEGLDVVLGYLIPVTGSATYPTALTGADIDVFVEAEQQILDRAVSNIRAAHPDLDIRPILLPGGAADALNELSREAALVVVGSNGKGGALR